MCMSVSETGGGLNSCNRLLAPERGHLRARADSQPKSYQDRQLEAGSTAVVWMGCP